MELISKILTVFFEDCEIDPATISEVEIVPNGPGEWFLHVQPRPDWFVYVSYRAGQWGANLYDYLKNEWT